MSITSFILLCFTVGPLTLVTLTLPLPNISNIALSRTLPVLRNWKSLLLAFLFYLLGFILFFTGEFISVSPSITGGTRQLQLTLIIVLPLLTCLNRCIAFLTITSYLNVVQPGVRRRAERDLLLLDDHVVPAVPGGGGRPRPPAGLSLPLPRVLPRCITSHQSADSPHIRRGAGKQMSLRRNIQNLSR